MTTASLEIRNRGAVPEGASTGSPNPHSPCLLCSDAFRGAQGFQHASQVRVVALPSRQGEGVQGKEAETQRSRVARGKCLAMSESTAEAGLKATFVCPT